MRLQRAHLHLSCLLLGAVLSGSSSKADEADDQYAVAAGHYAQQRWKFAVEEFEAFLAKHPGDSRAGASLFFLGEALVQLGRHGDALAGFQEYLRREPGGQYARSALFRAGEAAYLAEKTPEAKSLLLQFADKYPGDELNAHVLPYLGEIALGEKDLAGAESYFRKGLTRFPEGRLQDDCRFGLARALERQDKNAEAEKFYLALAGKPTSRLAADAQLRLGAVQYALGKYAEAAESFAAFEAKWEGNAQLGAARLGRGWALMKLDRAKEAAALFEKVASDPKLAIEARYWLGLAQKAGKDWGAAAKTLVEASAADPTSPLAAAIRFHAGDALLHAGDYAAARRQFEAVVDAASGRDEWIADSMLGICQAALRQKDYAAIDRQAAAFLRRFPANSFGAEVRRLLARSLIERKVFQKAADVLGTRSADAGKNEQGIEEMYLSALAYEGLKRYDDALAALKPVLASDNASLKADAQLAQASVFIASKRFAEAIVPLEAFLASQPASEAAVKAQGNLAICLARTKQLDRAKKLYAAIVEKHPRHELIPLMTEQLAEAAYEAGDTAWSKELFARLAQTGPAGGKQMSGLAGLGWSQFKAGNLEEAAATFGQVLAKGPEPALAAETALVRGQVLEKLKKADDALAMYDLVIDRHQASKELPQALLAAARLRHGLQQNERAAALLERLTKEFPKLPEMDAALYDWAWVLTDMGKLPESAEAFERLRREFPQSPYWPDATFRLAQRAFAAKQSARAKELAAAALGRNPGAAVRENVMFLLAQIAAAEEKWQEAKDAFESVVKQFPSGSLRLLAEYGAAEAVFRLGDFEAARTRFQQLAGDAHGRDKAISAVALLRQAQAFAHQEKWEDAFRLASQVESAFPGFEEQYEADYILGRCLANRAEFEKAREAYRRVIHSPGGKKTKTAANAQLLIAETFFHQKDYETALREYLKVEILYAFPAVQAAALLQAGKCHEALREWRQAAEAYARVADRYRDTTFAKEAADRLTAARQRAEAEERK